MTKLEAYDNYAAEVFEYLNAEVAFFHKTKKQGDGEARLMYLKDFFTEMSEEIENKILKIEDPELWDLLQ